MLKNYHKHKINIKFMDTFKSDFVFFIDKK